MTIYETEDLKAEIIDGDSVSLTLWGEHAITMTLEEWFKINRSIPTAETVKFDVFG